MKEGRGGGGGRVRERGTGGVVVKCFYSNSELEWDSEEEN